MYLRRAELKKLLKEEQLLKINYLPIVCAKASSSSSEYLAT